MEHMGYCYYICFMLIVILYMLLYMFHNICFIIYSSYYIVTIYICFMLKATLKIRYHRVICHATNPDSRTQPGCAPQASGTEDQGAKGCCDEGLCRSHGVPPTFLGLDLV